VKIVVYGGTGQVGSEIVAEAARRGHEVIAVSRRGAPQGAAPNVSWLAGDATDIDDVAKRATEADVVVSAVGPTREPGGDPFAFAGVVRGLADSVAGTRLVVVGGAGSLLTAAGTRLVDTPEFPAAYRPEALATAEALEFLRSTDPSVDWTYLSPAPLFEAGERTGSYVVGSDTPVGSFISFADYAIAVVDEIEEPAHRRVRWTVAAAS
jgi:putative NADH-flavin reductase